VEIKCICGNKTFDVKTSGPHTGLYCKKCGKWVKWATPAEIKRYRKPAKKKTETVSAKPPSRTSSGKQKYLSTLPEEWEFEDVEHIDELSRPFTGRHDSGKPSVGDEVFFMIKKGPSGYAWVTKVLNDTCYVLHGDGVTGKIPVYKARKTGRHCEGITRMISALSS